MDNNYFPKHQTLNQDHQPNHFHKIIADFQKMFSNAYNPNGNKIPQ